MITLSCISIYLEPIFLKDEVTYCCLMYAGVGESTSMVTFIRENNSDAYIGFKHGFIIKNEIHVRKIRKKY